MMFKPTRSIRFPHRSEGSFRAGAEDTLGQRTISTGGKLRCRTSRILFLYEHWQPPMPALSALAKLSRSVINLRVERRKCLWVLTLCRA
jgi:hypothetical protein